MSGKNESGERKRSVLHTALPLPLVFAAIVILSFLAFSGRSAENERALCAGVAFSAAEEVVASVQRFMDEGTMLQSALEKNPYLDKSSIEAISSAILRSLPSVTGVSTAPSAIVKYHFPEAGNASLIGHDLLSNPERRDALTRSVELKAPVVSGPFESVEGSSVLFLRYPVFSGERLWGFTSLTVDFGAMIEAFALERHYPGFSFAISDEPGNAVSEDVVLPGTIWKIHVKPSRGWTVADPFLYVLLIAGLTGAAALFVAFRSKTRGPGMAKASAEGLSALEIAVRAAREMGPAAQPPSETPAAPIEAVLAIPSTPQETAPREGNAAPESVVEMRSTPAAASSRRGREVKFIGPDVKGQLYMPDILFQGDPSLIFAAAGKEKNVNRPAPVFADPAIRPSSPAPASTVPPSPLQRRQEFLFSLEEEPRKVDMAILVVDDSEANRDIVGRMLSLRGYKADFAASGEEAIELCSSRHYAIIFMDCFMPGMDGYRTSSLLRAAHPEAKSTIVGLSARVGDQEIERCRLAGMDDLLAKPFTLKQLLTHIEKN